jgi:mannose-6-phosphate isomerase-like protein (cupin superfamily)
MIKPTTQRSARDADERGKPLDLRSTYAHLIEEGSASLIPISETYWTEVMRGEHSELEQGRLVSCFDFEKNWASWERHPHGEELVILLRGQVQLLLEHGAGVEQLRLTEPGQFVSIPRGTWHTVHTEGPCSMLFVTPGRGTEHKPA